MTPQSRMPNQTHDSDGGHVPAGSLPPRIPLLPSSLAALGAQCQPAVDTHIKNTMARRAHQRRHVKWPSAATDQNIPQIPPQLQRRRPQPHLCHVTGTLQIKTITTALDFGNLQLQRLAQLLKANNRSWQSRQQPLNVLIAFTRHTRRGTCNTASLGRDKPRIRE